MMRFGRTWILAVGAFVAVVCSGAPRAAAQDSGIAGRILDVAGKPWADLKIEIISDQGMKQETATDKNGKYSFVNLRAGEYVINVMLPNQPQPYSGKVRVGGGQTVPADFNFKDIVAKAGAEYQEAQKKQEAENQKFQGMKQHFEAGVAALTASQQAKAELSKTPADQRDAVKQQITDNANKAVTELEASKAAAGEKDSNLNLIMARLGDAYEAAGRTDDAVVAYKQAIELKPSAAYYNNLGGIYGRAGKIDEAMAAYQKSAELDPPNAAQAWRNFGITLYNANRLKEAVEPLKKATELDPNNAQGWYLLGASLVGAMETKKVGDKLEFVIQPGTVEAYQKALELDPNGPYGQQAKQGLDALKAIQPGIETKVNARKKKS